MHVHAFLVHAPPDAQGLSLCDTLIIGPDTSIGIEQARQIQHFLARKPIQSDYNTVVIHQAHLLTIPAQNALLKTLEEPPGKAQIYLITDFPDQLLPTVLSRVQQEPNSKFEIRNSKELEKTKKLLDKLLAAGIGERLKLIEDQAFTRETALQFLNHLEYLVHEQITDATPHAHPHSHSGSETPGVLYNLIVQTRKYLKANCNVKLCMDNFALSC